MAKVKITQVRSIINKPAYQRRVLCALGIHKLNHFVIKEDNESTKGMIARVQHLVKVEVVNE